MEGALLSIRRRERITGMGKRAPFLAKDPTDQAIDVEFRKSPHFREFVQFPKPRREAYHSNGTTMSHTVTRRLRRPKGTKHCGFAPPLDEPPASLMKPHSTIFSLPDQADIDALVSDRAKLRIGKR